MLKIKTSLIHVILFGLAPYCTYSQHPESDSMGQLAEKHAKNFAEQHALRKAQGPPEKEYDPLKIGDSIVVLRTLPIVVIHAEYPGGYNKMLTDIYKNLVRPKKQVKGIISVEIYVNNNGKIGKVTILKGLNPDYNRAVYLAVLGLAKFKPAIDQKNKPTPDFVYADVSFN